MTRANQLTRISLLGIVSLCCALLLTGCDFASTFNSAKQPTTPTPSAQPTQPATTPATTPTTPENSSASSNGDQNRAFKDLTGKQYYERDLNGKVVLIVYWATWCPPCRSEIPSLNQLHEKYHKRGALILAISQDERLETVENFLKYEKLGQSISYPVVYGRDFLELFGTVPALPTMVLMDKQGNVVGRHQGTAPTQALSDAIEKLL